jgi:hypothetical protein
MNATPETATSHHPPAPFSNRNSNQPTPRVTPTKQTKPRIISNRERLRLEINVTLTKQRSETDSNREKEACFVGEGASDPPAFRPRLRRRPRPAESQIHPTPDHQIPNRESRRLETHVTPTKKRPAHVSNRESEAFFKGPRSTTTNAGIKITKIRKTAQKKPRGKCLGADELHLDCSAAAYCCGLAGATGLGAAGRGVAAAFTGYA